MTLDDLIRNARTAVTLWPCSRGWQASVMQGDISTWRVEIDADPVVALKAALGVSEKTNDGSVFD